MVGRAIFFVPSTSHIWHEGPADVTAQKTMSSETAEQMTLCTGPDLLAFVRTRVSTSVTETGAA